MTNLAGSPPLDILVRSSGVRRLSDFLMWQVWFDFRSVAKSLVAYGSFFLRRLQKTSSFTSSRRIGRISDFGTCFLSFWTTRPRCGVGRVRLGPVQLSFEVEYAVRLGFWRLRDICQRELLARSEILRSLIFDGAFYRGREYVNTHDLASQRCLTFRPPSPSPL